MKAGATERGVRETQPTATEITIAPEPANWKPGADGRLLGAPRTDWRKRTRAQLDLPDGPLVMTGHQPAFWHPGILAKHLAADRFALHRDIAVAQLLPDQDIGAFGRLEIPVRRADGALAVRGITLLDTRHRTPIGLQPARPTASVNPPDDAALPSVAAGATRLAQLVAAHRTAPSAAEQLARALDEAMAPWVRKMPIVTARGLMETDLARALLERMIADPQACAAAYSAAARAAPTAGVPPLTVRDDYVELPLWRIRDGERIRAYDGDVERWLAGDATMPLLPRALFLTAVIRLGVADLFVHGTGGEAYDRVMETWIGDWLGVTLAPVAVVSATARLPLAVETEGPDESASRRRLRRLWHDPAADGAMSAAKRAWLERIERAPRESRARREAFFAMHAQLAAERMQRADAISVAQHDVEAAMRRVGDARIAARRDWAFALYPRETIDDVAGRIEKRIKG